MVERARPFVGLIADTHGLLRPEAVAALRGSSLILHAGDVGDPAILDRLREIAPVHAISGNTDFGDLRNALPETEAVTIAPGVTAYMIHIRECLDLDPAAAGFDAVIFGHTHRPLVERENGVLYVNPGSAGPRRFDLPITVARMYLDEGELQAEIVDLEASGRL